MRFAQLKRGLGMAVNSLVVMKNNPRLLIFPVFAGLSALAFLALLFGSALGAIIGIEGVEAVETVAGLEETLSDNPAIVVAAVFLGYFSTTFLSVFFTGALVAESREVFNGKPVDLKRGMAAAWRAKYRLAVWALIAATVGIIIDSIESSDSQLSQIFAAIFGLAWTIITFFVVPVAVLDKESTVREMFTKSGQTFRENIGETVIGLAAPRAIGFVIAAVTVGAVLALNEITTSALVLFPILLVGLVISQLVSTTVRGVLKTSLYVYATEGKTPSEFSSADLDQMIGGSSGNS